MPLSQNVRTRTTAFYDKYDGNIFNQAPNVQHRVNGFKHYGVRSILEADASDRVKLTFIGDYHHNNDECCADIIGGPPLTGTGAVNTTALNLIQTVLPTLNGDKTRRIDQNLITRTIETGYGFSGQADVELGPMTVTSITAYRNFKNNEIRDGDFYPQAYIGAQQVHDTGPQTGHTFTQELRLTSPAHQLFTYVAGFFYSNTYTRRIFERDDIICARATGAVLPAGVLTPCTSVLAGPSTFASGIADYSATAKNVALFGQGTLNVAKRFRLIGGVRYTIDQLDASFIRTTPVPGASNPPFDAGVAASALLFPPFGNAAAANGVPLHLKATSDNFSGKAGAQFDVTENSTAYASYTRGYKGPAFNLFFNLRADGINTIAPETSNSFEIGLKNTLLDGKLTINLAGYYAKYFNFQANSPDTLTIGGFTQTIARFTNAGTVSTRGGEVDLVYRPLRDLSISGGAAYSDAHVDQFRRPTGGSVLVPVPNGTPLAFAPKWKASLAADYRIRTNSLPVDFALGAQGSYQSSQLSLFVADPVQRAAGTIHAYGLINLSASVLDKDDRYKLTFQVRNLTNESFAAAIATGGPSGAYRYQIPRDADRYFGVTGRVNF